MTEILLKVALNLSQIKQIIDLRLQQLNFGSSSTSTLNEGVGGQIFILCSVFRQWGIMFDASLYMEDFSAYVHVCGID